MPDPRVLKLAETLVTYCAAIKPGDKVFLNGDLNALPLLRETYKQAIVAGGLVVMQLDDEESTDFFMRHASDDQLAWVPPLSDWRNSVSDVSIFIYGTGNTRRLSSLDPARSVLRSKALRAGNAARSARSASGDHRWVLTLFPTQAYAQEADLSLAEFEDFVYRATFADQPDPVARWLAVRADQQKYVNWLKGKHEVIARGPHIDLTLRIDERTFINSDGRRNMPSGEIFTGPVEHSANGWVHFTYPAINGGRQVEGVQLRFAEGKVVEATASKNQTFLIAQLDTDPGARFLGEFAIGTNYGIDRFTGNILFDEKIGGTLHMALGNSYPETGGLNHSAIHWDMICDMRQDSTITVDGDVLYKNGQFTF